MAGVWYENTQVPDDLYLPMYTYSAEEIFKGDILLFDVDFFSPPIEIQEKTHTDENGNEVLDYYYYTDSNGNTDTNGDGVNDATKTSSLNSAAILRNTISSWYNALRNICLVLMLSVLIYIGIRILLTSVASEKAKYLTMLKDWFIGLCLLFLMHYIMAFSVTLVNKLTDVVKSSVNENGYAVTIQDKDGKIEEVVSDKLGMPDLVKENENGEKFVVWPTNFMGSLRLKLQMDDYGGEYIGLGLCFVVLCLFTLYFTFVYLKRLLYMAFLTLISPMVALTYCIDKLNDGQAQGFNKWFKEYIFNLLIQPMHLLLYYILITSVFALAGENVIYSMVAIAFMIPAEKLLRSLFGFEKAQTPGTVGTAGAMLAMSALNHFTHKGPKGKLGGNSDNNDDKNDNDSPPITRSNDPIGNFLNEPNGEETSNDYNLERGMQENRNLERQELNADNNLERRMQGNRSFDNQEPNGNIGIGNTSGIILPESTRQDMAQEKVRKQREERERKAQEEQERIRQQQIEQQERPKTKKTLRNRVGNTLMKNRNLNASWTAQKAAMRNAPRKFKRSIENSHPLRTAGRIAGGVALGAAAGAVGTAIAMSTGDADNVVKMAGGAATGGFMLGSGIAQRIESPLDDPKVKKAHDDAYNKGQFKQAAMDDYVNDFVKDVNNRQYFEQKFGKDEAKKMMKKDGEIEQYLYNNITDKKEMVAAHKLQKEGVVKNTDEAISVAQLSQIIGTDTTHMTKKKKEEWKTTVGDMAGKKGVKNKEEFADKRLNEIDKFHEFKK